MGRVYRAVDKKLNEEVALKLIMSEMATDKSMLERFHNMNMTLTWSIFAGRTGLGNSCKNSSLNGRNSRNEGVRKDVRPTH
jgi:serine/threonine protein kinase